MPLHRDPQERLDNIERELDRESIDPQLRAEIESKLPEIYQEYISLQSEEAFEQHMSKYITEAYKERQRGNREPLCTCSLPTCPLTNGKIPAKVRYNSNSLLAQQDGRRRVLEYMQNHRGAEVLHELIEAWDKREGELHRNVSRIHSQLINDYDENLREVPTANE